MDKFIDRSAAIAKNTYGHVIRCRQCWDERYIEHVHIEDSNSGISCNMLLTCPKCGNSAYDKDGKRTAGSIEFEMHVFQVE